jgi:hypothetical protein
MTVQNYERCAMDDVLVVIGVPPDWVIGSHIQF